MSLSFTPYFNKRSIGKVGKVRVFRVFYSKLNATRLHYDAKAAKWVGKVYA